MKLINAAIAAAVAFTYVGSIHYQLPQNLRGKDRNDPDMISFRLTRVLLACLAILVFAPLALVATGDYSSYWEVINRFGLVLGGLSSLWEEVLNIFRCVIVISSLYIGVIINYLVDVKFNVRVIIDDFQQECLSIYGFRDFFFAPFTEELVYRAIILLVLEPQFSRKLIMLFSPFLFGISHLHHGYELYVIRKHKLSVVLITILFQATYTNLFGVLENHLFFKYNSVWGCSIVHSICNFIGFPDLTIEGSPFRNGIYYTSLIIGIFLFYNTL